MLSQWWQPGVYCKELTTCYHTWWFQYSCACMHGGIRSYITGKLQKQITKKFLICVCPTLSLFIHPHSASKGDEQDQGKFVLVIFWFNSVNKRWFISIFAILLFNSSWQGCSEFRHYCKAASFFYVYRDQQKKSFKLFFLFVRHILRQYLTDQSSSLWNYQKSVAMRNDYFAWC